MIESEKINLSLDEKINLIKNSKSLDDLSLKAMPDVFEDDFYFISYSHRDYKDVYKDLLLLEEYGIKIWYDRGMVPGKDWSEKAEEILSKYHCKGIIFYLSKNSLISPAIYQEINIVKKWNKPFFSINFEINGVSRSVKDMLDFYDIKSKNNKNICSFFYEKNIFLGLETETSKKIEKIKLFNKIPEFEYEDNSINYIKYLNNKELCEFNEYNLPTDNRKIMLSQALFANTKNLRKIDFSNINFNNVIPNYCFYGCVGLEQVILPLSIVINGTSIDVVLSIGNSAFENTGLKNLDFLYDSYPIYELDRISYLEVMIKSKFTIKFGKRAFAGCKKITHLFLKPINELYKSYSFNDIAEEMFADDINLRELIIETSGHLKIGKRAFANCINLKKVTIVCDSFFFEDDSFIGCLRLEDFVLKTPSNDKTPQLWKGEGYLGEKINQKGNLFFDDDGKLLFFFDNQKGNYAMPTEIKEINGSINTLNITNLDFTKSTHTVINNKLCFCPKLKMINFSFVSYLGKSEFFKLSKNAYSILVSMKSNIIYDKLDKIQYRDLSNIFIDQNYNNLLLNDYSKTLYEKSKDKVISNYSYSMVKLENLNHSDFVVLFGNSIFSKIYFKDEWVKDSNGCPVPCAKIFENNNCKIYKNNNITLNSILNASKDGNIKFKEIKKKIVVSDLMSFYMALKDNYYFDMIDCSNIKFDENQIEEFLESKPKDVLAILMAFKMYKTNKNVSLNEQIYKLYSKINDIFIKTLCYDLLEYHSNLSKEEVNKNNLIANDIASYKEAYPLYLVGKRIITASYFRVFDVDYNKGIMLLIASARLGNLRAVLLLANIYCGSIFGIKTNLDYSKSLRLYQEVLKYKDCSLVKMRIDLLEKMIKHDFDEDLSKNKVFSSKSNEVIYNELFE